MDAIADKHGNATLKITNRQAFQLHGVIKGDLRAGDPRGEQGAPRHARRVRRRRPQRDVQPEPAPLVDCTRARSRSRRPSRATFRRARRPTTSSGSTTNSSRAASRRRPRSRSTGRPTCRGNSRSSSPSRPATTSTSSRTTSASSRSPTTTAGSRASTSRSAAGWGCPTTRSRPTRASPTCSGFCRPDQVVEVAEKIVTVQRDFGDRTDRKHARFKYTVADRGPRLDPPRGRAPPGLGARLAAPV